LLDQKAPPVFMLRIIAIKVVPRSSRNEIVGELPDGTLKVRLTAAPVDGAANKKLIAFLSEEWGVAQSKLRIVRGEKSRNKLVEIDG